MENLEYLEKNKKRDEEWFKSNGFELDQMLSNFNVTYRNMKAMEIIAEELCKLNNLMLDVTENGSHTMPSIRVRNQ